MSEFKERFRSFTSPNYVSLIAPASHIRLYIGTDDQMRYLIELRGKFTPKKIASTSAIEVTQYKNSEYNVLRLTLIDDEICEPFYAFCEDLAEQTNGLTDESQGYVVIINRFIQWKQLFVASRKKKLSEFEIMGLIAEILFLRGWLADKYTLPEALKAWSGQELTHKDFSVGDTWYEVKAVSRGKPSVRISSLEQLDSENPGELVVFPLEKMSEEYHGITLNLLVTDTLQMFTNSEERDSFRQKVALQGYEKNAYYDAFVFSVGNMKRYLVDNNFPRITRKQIPEPVVNCVYDLSLRDLERYQAQE